MDKNFMNKMDNMEMDKVSGGRRNPGGGGKNPCPSFHDGSANSMAANVDETQMKLPIAGGHKIILAAKGK